MTCRASGTLKYTLAVRQHTSDSEERRRQIGAAVAVTLRVMPLVVAVCAVVTWLAPSLIHADTSRTESFRWAVGLSCISVALTPLLNLPGNVLRGMNLDNLGTASSIVILIAGGCASVLVIHVGFGLTGLAAVGLVSSACGGCLYYCIAKRALPWFGRNRPSPGHLKLFTRQTLWLLVGSLGQILLNSSDLLVTGILLGPAAAAVYGVTGAVLRLALDPLFSLLLSGSPGIAGLCGRHEWKRVEQLRLEIHLIAILLVAVLGTGVAVLNRAFLSLWIGEGFFAGRLTNMIRSGRGGTKHLAPR